MVEQRVDEAQWQTIEVWTMWKRSPEILLLSIIVLTSLVLTAQPGQEPRNDTGRTSVAGNTTRSILDRYCVTCHNARLKTANLVLDELDVSRLAAHADV